ncbi:class I SAM-dependent methyltransferase [candidate division KSB1 bacterium]|nr:class I SAM-dependent methyltransferase [candidate division KSB1 bacterium]
MKIRNPNSRFKIKPKRSDLVLEVGGGHNPHPRSNIVVDKFHDSNYHRSDDVKVHKDQLFLIADGEHLPFKDNAFDYVINNHVIEHVPDPAQFFDELSRVAKRGYVEAPSLIGEHLIPKESHTWGILEIDDKIVMMKKSNLSYIPKLDFGDLLLYFIAQNSIGFKILQKTYPNLLTVRYEWQDKIDYIIEPSDPELRSYFMQTWDMEKITKVFKRKSKVEELVTSVAAFFEVLGEFAFRKVFKSRFEKKAVF